MMRINIKEVNATQNAVILHFSGELNSDSISEISDSFNKLESYNRNFAIADMTEASLISSAALGELMGARKRLVERGGDLVLAGLKIEIRTKLNLMGATKIFRIFSDNRSALNAYKWQVERNPEMVHVTFPPYLEIVPPLRQLISRIAKFKGYSNKDSFRIETIVDEVCNNAVEHGKQGNDQKVDLKMNIDPKKIELDVINMSDPDKMDSLKALLKPREGGQEVQSDNKRGRGLALIKMLTDELTVDCSEKGTSVHIKKVREE
ncbi:MAG: STAS domain-containing protein [Fibrobacter sp.]|jgi:anti-anti-sigma factor|nr:STAS domain-containing protein [Fibrobacter sp.]